MEQARPLPALAPAVCGTGFAATEDITLTLTGRLGVTSWSVVADASGQFRSALPSTACHYAPGALVARGNKGGVSNTLSLSLLFCPAGY
jgi:hypothetical protein